MIPIEYVFAPAAEEGSDGLLGIVIRAISSQAIQGVQFFTTKDCAQQVGIIQWPTGHVIPPHVHVKVQRVIDTVPETLMVVEGRLHCLFYTDAEVFVVGKVLFPGDVVVLLNGGHGFEVMDSVKIYEVRQGPYLSKHDKRRFQDPQRLRPCPTSQRSGQPLAAPTTDSTATNETPSAAT